MTAASLPRRRMSRLARAEAKWALIFIAPWIIGFLAFTLLPMIATLTFTFTNINLDQQDPLGFVGFANYQRLFADSQAWDSLGVTLRFAVLALPVGVFLPLLVALLLSNPRLKGSGIFRVLFFLPYVVPFVAGVLIWQAMLNPADGWINVFLRLVGVSNPPDWLRDSSWVYPGLVFIGIWGIGGGTIVYLAGLRGIPTEYYDAARIDGAGYFGQLRHVTLPLSLPGVTTASLFGVLIAWDEFFYALIFTSTSQAKTLPVAIAEFTTRHAVDFGLMSAGGIVAALPPVLLAFALQRYLIAGLTAGAVKA